MFALTRLYIQYETQLFTHETVSTFNVFIGNLLKCLVG